MAVLSFSTSSSETFCGTGLGDLTLKGRGRAVEPLEEGGKDIVVPCAGTETDVRGRIALEEPGEELEGGRELADEYMELVKQAQGLAVPFVGL
jgi:hypothetical protein